MISAAAGIVGALAGGFASYLGTLETQHGEDERIERRIDAEVRGASRVLFSRFGSANRYTDRVLEENEFLVRPPEFIADIAPEDLKLITGRLAVHEYRAVDAAFLKASDFFATNKERAGQQLTPSDRGEVRALQEEIATGLNALVNVADLSPSGQARGDPPD